jgi:hypothetical protein
MDWVGIATAGGADPSFLFLIRNDKGFSHD